MPDQVGPDHRDVNITRHLQSAHLAPEMLAAVHDFARHGAVRKNAAFVVNIAQEQVERGNALGQSAFDAAPFRAGDQAGQQVIGKDALRPLLPAVDREGDALVQKGEVGGVLAPPDFVGGQRRKCL